MRRAEEAIEKVLAGLRDAEAPVGMERRILNAVQDRVTAKATPRWPRWWAWSAGLGVMAAGCLVIPVIHRIGHRSGPVEMQMGSHSIAAGRTAPVALEGVAHGNRVSSLRSNGELRAQARSAERASDPDAMALREMRAVSYPAPPMPLTEEEKLLLRVAHKGDPVELALLNPEMRARQVAEGKAEFQRFFGLTDAGQSATEKSTTGDNE